MKKLMVKTCADCPHGDWVAQYNPSRAFPNCRAMPQPEETRPTRPRFYGGSGRVLPYDEETMLYTGEIPEWCPLSDEGENEMASIEVPIKIETLSALHDAMRDAAQEYFKTTGVKLERVSFDWIDGETTSLLRCVNLDTTKRA